MLTNFDLSICRYLRERMAGILHLKNEKHQMKNAINYFTKIAIATWEKNEIFRFFFLNSCILIPRRRRRRNQNRGFWQPKRQTRTQEKISSQNLTTKTKQKNQMQNRICVEAHLYIFTFFSWCFGIPSDTMVAALDAQALREWFFRCLDRFCF